MKCRTCHYLLCGIELQASMGMQTSLMQPLMRAGHPLR